MMRDLDKFRPTNILIREHGEDADLAAAMRCWRGAIWLSADVHRRQTECPLLAISGHTAGSSRTSALPPKADITAVGNFRRSILAVLLDEGVAAAENVEAAHHSFSNVLIS